MKSYAFKEQVLGRIIEDKIETCGDMAFLQYEEREEVTYGEVNATANRIANGLLEFGLEKGDKVATFLPNCLEAVYLWFGISKAGLVDVPINPANNGDFLSHILNNSDAKVIVIDCSLLDKLKSIENQLSRLQKPINRLVQKRRETKNSYPDIRSDRL